MILKTINDLMIDDYKIIAYRTCKKTGRVYIYLRPKNCIIFFHELLQKGGK